MSDLKNFPAVLEIDGALCGVFQVFGRDVISSEVFNFLWANRIDFEKIGKTHDFRITIEVVKR